MKLSENKHQSKAMTLTEVIVVVAVIVVLIGLLLPALVHPPPRHRLRCVNNLRQIGLSFLIFATDNDDKFPWQISTNDGGSREFREAANSVFRHFQAVSNELSTPRLLVCTEDEKRTWATNWLVGFDNRNVSYFIGLNAIETNKSSILSGDRYLDTRRFPTNGFLELTTNDIVRWTKKYHDYHGNLLWGDGSVRQLDTAGLQLVLRDSGVATNRLAMP